MADLQHDMGGDLILGIGGDMAVRAETDEVSQSVSHRLLTGPGNYIWHPDYGAGLPGMVGGVINSQQLAAVIRSQVSRDSNVSALPPPVVTINTISNGFVIATIQYRDAVTGSTRTQQMTLE